MTCVAAIAAIEMMRQPAFLARVERIGVILRDTLEGWKRRHPLIGDVRGLGSMMLIELVKDRATKEPAADETLAIVKAALPPRRDRHARGSLHQRHPIPAAARRSPTISCTRASPSIEQALTEVEARHAAGGCTPERAAAC